MKCILFISGVCIRICVSLSNARFINTHSKTSPGHSCRQALDTTPSHCTSTLTTTSSHSQLPPRVCNGRASSLQRHGEDTQELDPRHLQGAPHHHRLGATCRSFQQLGPHFPSFFLSFFPLTTRNRCSFPIFEAASVLCDFLVSQQPYPRSCCLRCTVSCLLRPSDPQNQNAALCNPISRSLIK